MFRILQEAGATEYPNTNTHIYLTLSYRIPTVRYAIPSLPFISDNSTTHRGLSISSILVLEWEFPHGIQRSFRQCKHDMWQHPKEDIIVFVGIERERALYYGTS